MSDEVPKIAGGLSEAQRRTIVKIVDLGSNPYGWSARDLGTSGRTMFDLWGAGLVIGGNVYGSARTYIISDIGLAVRAHLNGQARENGDGLHEEPHPPADGEA